MARDVAGAIKVGKGAVALAAFDVLIRREGDRFVSGMTVDLVGKPGIAIGEPDAGLTEQFEALAARAIASGQAQKDASGLILAAPASVGEKGEIAGAVAVRSSADGPSVQVAAQQMRAVLLAVAVFAVLMLAGAWLSLHMPRKPLQAVAAAMDRVVAADYVSPVPMIVRQDEVGQIAQSLDVMRHALNLAETIASAALANWRNKKLP